MYEYKIFEAEEFNLASMNALLETLSQTGWEPVTVDTNRMSIVAKRPKLLND